MSALSQTLHSHTFFSDTVADSDSSVRNLARARRGERDDEILCARVIAEYMTYELFTRIVLKEDIPAYGLRKGDVATIIE